MDGILRQVTPKTWRGRLLGHDLEVFRHGGHWVASIYDARGHTLVQLSARQFDAAAARARAWIEERAAPTGDSLKAMRD